MTVVVASLVLCIANESGSSYLTGKGPVKSQLHGTEFFVSIVDKAFCACM